MTNCPRSTSFTSFLFSLFCPSTFLSFTPLSLSSLPNYWSTTLKLSYHFIFSPSSHVGCFAPFNPSKYIIFLFCVHYYYDTQFLIIHFYHLLLTLKPCLPTFPSLNHFNLISSLQHIFYAHNFNLLATILDPLFHFQFCYNLLTFKPIVQIFYLFIYLYIS